MPSATVGASYTQALTISGGVAPYSFAITSGALPAGLTFDAHSGTISGTATAGGSFNFTVKATDSSTGTGPFSKSQNYSLNVAAPVITINPGSLANATVGTAYLQSVVATSGTAAYTFGITSGCAA